MDNFHIKIIALVTMIIDHTGYILFPEEKYYLLRVIGRMSFPLYAFLISEGCYYSKNIKKYMLRLISFALLIEISILIITNFKEKIIVNSKNIFFTLFFGVLVVYLSNILKNKFIFYTLFLIVGILSEIFKFDYGFLGIFLIYAFYEAKAKEQNIKIRKIKEILVLFVFSIVIYFPKNIYLLQYFLGTFMASVPIIFYKDKLGYKLKWLFYFIYPIHFIILYFIKYLLNK